MNPEWKDLFDDDVIAGVPHHVAGIHVLLLKSATRKTWMAGTSPARTVPSPPQ